MACGRREYLADIDSIVNPDCELSQSLNHFILITRSLSRHVGILTSCRLVQGRKLAAMYPQLSALDLVFVFIKSLWRWPGCMRTVFVESAPVTRTHEQVRLLKPAHRTPQMGAIDGKDLKFLAFNSPHPAGNVCGLAIPWACIRISEFRHARLVLGERCKRSKRNPGGEPAIITEGRKQISKQG